MPRLLEELTTEEKQNLVNDVIDKKNGELKLEWADIVNKYDLDMSGDTLRKAGVGIKLADDASMIMSMGTLHGNRAKMLICDDASDIKKSDIEQAFSNIGFETLLDPAVCESLCKAQDNDCVTTHEDEAYVKRQMVRDLNRETNKAYRAISRDNLLREAVEDAVRKYSEPFREIDTDAVVDGTGQLVVLVGDIHFGEEMNVRGFYGEPINIYNDQVCRNRMDELLRRVVGIVGREKPRNIQVMLVGDCVAGMLRMSQLQNLQYGIVDSTIKFGNLFSNWIMNMANHTGVHVDVHMVGGNHDEVRPLGSKAGEFPRDNIINIVNWYMQSRFNGIDAVSIHELTGRFHMVDIEGYKFLMLHGDGGKIGDICRDSVNVYGHHIDYFVCGHLHHEEELASGTTKDGHSVIVRCPSMCGMDGYAQKLGRFSKPGATVMMIEKGIGRRCVYPIELK